jgi:hypothetical protein
MQSKADGRTINANTPAKNVTAKRIEASFTKIVMRHKNRNALEPSVVTADPSTALVMTSRTCTTAISLLWRLLTR